MPLERRRFDVVVFGTTGFTTRLAEHFAAHAAEADVRSAIAGRSNDKLGAVHRERYPSP